MPEWWEIHLLFFLHNELLDPDAIEAKMANLANYELKKI